LSEEEKKKTKKNKGGSKRKRLYLVPITLQTKTASGEKKKCRKYKGVLSILSKCLAEAPVLSLSLKRG
jgi:hypothetical protein